MISEKFPFKNFGHKLKTIREQKHETVAEVSGAVEIDENELIKIERGELLPSEDILMLLISHFGITESDGRKLFELATNFRQQVESSFDEQLIKQMLMVIPVDNRILYSDSTNINVNGSGVVINFQQANGKTPMQIARIGMSKDHAKKFINVLHEAIEKSETAKKPKLLGEPKNNEQQR